jgi:hypothetical protein
MKKDLHLPQLPLAMYQKGVYNSGIKILIGLPQAIKDISSKPKKVKIALKHYMLTNSFYSLDEYFSIFIQRLLCLFRAWSGVVVKALRY